MIPKKIKIRREKGYHTGYIGRWKDGTQFMAFIVGVPVTRTSSAQGKVTWYAVLHRFDSEGKHLGTESSLLGTNEFAHQLKGAQATLRKMIRTLGTVKYCDVEVALFSVRIDGHKFGLVDASIPKEGYERIDLLPNGLAFFPPWDGTYET